MTALQTITAPVLPTPKVPVPNVANQQLLQCLLAGGLYRDKIKAGQISTKDLPALHQLISELEPMVRPAALPDAAAVLDRLFAHYFRPDLPNHIEENRLDDWYDDLEGIPLDILQAAARDWRRSDAKYAPTPGQFLEKTKRYSNPRTYAYTIGKMVVAALEEQQPPQEAAA